MHNIESHTRIIFGFFCFIGISHYPSRTPTLILQDLARFLQMTPILQDARSGRLSCKNLARSCKIDVEKCSRKKLNFKVLLTQRSFSLMSSDVKGSSLFKTETFISLLPSTKYLKISFQEKLFNDRFNGSTKCESLGKH